MVEVHVEPLGGGKKLYRWLRQMLPGIPLSGIQKMIRTGRVRLNGKKAKPDDVVQPGDVVRLAMSADDFAQVSRPARKFAGVSSDIEVLYEDEALLAVNKPAGLLTHGAPGEYKDTLVNRVAAYLYRTQHGDARRFLPAPVHRLDRNTSGVVLFAKTAEAARTLAEDLRSHAWRKMYLALVRGVPPVRGKIDVPLARINSQRTQVVADAGKPAVTVYERLASAGGTSLLKVELVSGRTHQIRAHFASIGYPLWGDVKYGGGVVRGPVGQQGHSPHSPAVRHSATRLTALLGEKQKVASHQWLHAWYVQLPNGRVVTAPLPAAFLHVLRHLGYTDKALQRILAPAVQEI
ncbi:MAG: RluA family pseudouridine synthase [Alicyclobacillus sp.]|nr:RluA family pseudouridine synthase [Alicyclobacillus sp.]